PPSTQLSASPPPPPIYTLSLHDALPICVIAFMRPLRALGPAQRELHRALDHLWIHRLAIDVHRRALVEDHHHIRVKHFLDVHALLGAEEDGAAVGGRLEGHALLGDPALVCQREHLEAARIGEDRPVPAGETVQAAVVGDHLQPRPQVQVEGVAQDDFGAQSAQLVRQHALDRTVGTHRHESGRFYRPTGERQAAAARGPIGGQQLEIHPGHQAGAQLRAAPAGKASGASTSRSPISAPSWAACSSHRSTSTTSPPARRTLPTWCGPRNPTPTSTPRIPPAGSQAIDSGRSSTSPPSARPSARAETRLPRPMKSATKRSAGRRYSACALSHCRMRPRSITPIRSAMANASAWSWVTISTVVPAALSRLRSSPARRWRVSMSRLENGSSSSSRA